MILTILRIMFLRLCNNPLELLLVFAMPVAFFSVFSAIFSNGITIGNEKKLRVGWVSGRETQLGNELRNFLEQNAALSCLPLDVEDTLKKSINGFEEDDSREFSLDALITDAQRSGKYDLILRLPSDFPSSFTKENLTQHCYVRLVSDSQNPMALSVVSSAVKGFFVQKKANLAAEQLKVHTLSQQQTVDSWRTQSGDRLIDSSVDAQRLSASWAQKMRWFASLNSPHEFLVRGTQFMDPTKESIKVLQINSSLQPLFRDATCVLAAQGAIQETGKSLVEPIEGAESTCSQLRHRLLPPNGLGTCAHLGGRQWMNLAQNRPAALLSMQEELDFFEKFGELPDFASQGIRYSNPDNVPSKLLFNDLKEKGLIQSAHNVTLVEGIVSIAPELASALPTQKSTWSKLLNSPRGMQPFSVPVDMVNIRVENPQSAGHENPRIAMYAAGIAVLFLLFSSTGNAATLLEEAESGTLDRILVGKASLFHVILGKWLGVFFIGCIQISVMFLWAELIFQIRLWQHLGGFALMTCCTAAATSSLAMLMATLCRTRAQLNAVSVVLILSMSAVGGSMIPRFVMSDRMKEIGKWTFNAWALDGYQKVFWYQSPISSLIVEVSVLTGSALVFGTLALILSQRWKSVG